MSNTVKPAPKTAPTPKSSPTRSRRVEADSWSASGSSPSLSDRVELSGAAVRERLNQVSERAGAVWRRLTGSPLAENRDRNATVAVIDYFDNADRETTHGERVESILRERAGLGEEDVQRYQAGSGTSMRRLRNASSENIERELGRYVEGRVTGLLDGSSRALEDILEQPEGNIRTVNQSLGVPEIRIARDLHRSLGEDDNFRRRYLEHAGLPSNASQREVLQALVDDVADAREQSSSITRSQARYDRLTGEAESRGITMTVSSGNYGAFARTLRREGVEVDAEFYRDPLVNSNVIGVGATDDRNTGATKDDRTAALNTPDAGATIAAPGVGVRTRVDGRVQAGNGTSYAAPQVAAAAERLRREFPQLTPRQIAGILTATADSGNFSAKDVGAGDLRPELALALARNKAYVA